MQVDLKTLLARQLGLLLLSTHFVSCLPTDYQEAKVDPGNVSISPRGGRPVDTVFGVSRELDRTLRIGDRFYVKSVYQNAFGPSYDSSNFVFGRIISKQDIFGGACDLYESSRNVQEIEFQDLRCFSDTWSTDQVLPSNALREGFRIQVCEKIVTSQVASRSFAFAEAGVDPVNDDLSADKVAAIFALFHPARQVPESAYLTFEESKDSFSSKSQLWNTVLMTACLDPTWQIP
jgi:hypothetical protein